MEHDDKKLRLSYEDVKEAAEKVSERVKGRGLSVDYILGITVGGLVPLALVAKYLHMQAVSTVSAVSYSEGEGGHMRGELRITALPDIDLRGKHILLVDEIADSGVTLHRVKQALMTRYNPSEITTAVIVTNTAHCEHLPDISIIDTTSWVVFPWEV